MTNFSHNFLDDCTMCVLFFDPVENVNFSILLRMKNSLNLVPWLTCWKYTLIYVGTGLEVWEYGRGDPSRWPRGTLHPQNLALTSPTSGGRSVGIVRSPTQTTEFSFFISWNGSCMLVSNNSTFSLFQNFISVVNICSVLVKLFSLS
jgi:hypothetical protein